jgi:MarR family transcriptional regulator for hemolysin
MTKRNPLDRQKRSFTPNLPSLAPAPEGVPGVDALGAPDEEFLPLPVPVTDAPNSPEEQAAALRDVVGRLHHLLQREAQRSLGRQLSLAKVLALEHLHREPEGLSSTELAERAHLAPASLVPILNHLVKEGLAQRNKLSGPRKDRVTLTEKGREETLEVVQRHQRDLAEILSVLPDADREAMELLLSRALSRLESRFVRPTRVGR